MLRIALRDVVVAAGVLVALGAACGRPGLVVDGPQLRIDAASPDGKELAYHDGARRLFTLPAAGGTPKAVTTGVDNARYAGPFLIGIHGNDPTRKIALSADVRGLDGKVTPLGIDVRVSSLLASPDGKHLLFERVVDAVRDARDVVVDGVVVATGALKENEAWSPTSTFAVVGLKTVSGSGATAVSSKLVRLVPTDGTAPRDIVATGSSTHVAVTHDGANVVAGINCLANLCDLALVSVASSTTQTIAAQAVDASFLLTLDGSTLVYLAGNPLSAALTTTRLDATGTATLKPSGVVDVVFVSASHVVYATQVDAVSTLGSLGVVALDGTGDQALGDAARVLGFTDGDKALVYETDVDVALDVGTLKSLNLATGAVTVLAPAVQKAALANANIAVFLDVNQHLAKVTLTGEATPIQLNVDDFVLIPDGVGLGAHRVAYSIKGNANAGVWVDPL